jgi:hypothetical protein
MKKLLIAALLSLSLTSTPTTAQISVSQAILVGGVLGYVVGKETSPPRFYAPWQPAQYGIIQPPVVIHQSQIQGYNDRDHGFCAPYQNEAYYSCLGNLQRVRNENAYYQGLRGGN